MLSYWNSNPNRDTSTILFSSSISLGTKFKNKIVAQLKTQEFAIMVNLATAFENEGISASRFDFSGNGESEGSFYYGNYNSKAEDLRSVVDYFTGLNRTTVVVLGHKGDYRVTQESMTERLNTNIHEACLSIDESCRVLAVHGSADTVIPVEEAKKIAKIIPNHRLIIIDGANHSYTSHQAELVSSVLPFVKECMQMQ